MKYLMQKEKRMMKKISGKPIIALIFSTQIALFLIQVIHYSFSRGSLLGEVSQILGMFINAGIVALCFFAFLYVVNIAIERFKKLLKAFDI